MLLSLAFKFFELLSLVLLWLTQIAENYHQLSQTFQIFGVLVDNVFLVFESLLLISHSPVARSHHQSPFHFSRLYLTCSFEKDAGFLVEVVLDLVAAEPGNGVEHHGLEAKRLQKLLEGLRLVFLLEIQVGQTHEHVRVRTDLGHQDILPLHGVTCLLAGFVRVSDLPHHFRSVPDDGLNFFLGLDSLSMAAYSAVD